MLLPQSTKESEVNIIDNLGRIVLTQTLAPMQDRIELRIDLLENGNYIVLWTDNIGVRTEKLVIAR